MLRIRSTDDTITLRLDESVREKIISEHEQEKIAADFTQRLARVHEPYGAIRFVRARLLCDGDRICATEDGRRWYQRERVTVNEPHPQEPERYRQVFATAAPGFRGSGMSRIDADAFVAIVGLRP